MLPSPPLSPPCMLAPPASPYLLPPPPLHPPYHLLCLLCLEHEEGHEKGEHPGMGPDLEVKARGHNWGKGGEIEQPLMLPPSPAPAISQSLVHSHPLPLSSLSVSPA